MDTVPGLRELQERKRVLLLESQLNRQILRVELSRLRYRAARLRKGFDWANHAWRWGAPLAGFLIARKFNRTAGAFAKGSALVGALRSLWNLWSSKRNSRPDRRAEEFKDGID